MTNKRKIRRASNLDGKRKKLMRKRGLYFDQDFKRYLKKKFGEFEPVGIFPEVVERIICKNTQKVHLIK